MIVLGADTHKRSHTVAVVSVSPGPVADSWSVDRTAAAC